MGTHAIQVPNNTPCRHCGESAKAPVQRLQASRAFAEAGPAASAETASAEIAGTTGTGFGHDLARLSVRPPTHAADSRTLAPSHSRTPK